MKRLTKPEFVITVPATPLIGDCVLSTSDKAQLSRLVIFTSIKDYNSLLRCPANLPE
jgi:hypothetical protein